MSFPGTLQDIFTKARELSASGNSLQVTDQKLTKYLNAVYMQDIPLDLRILKLKDIFTFVTTRGIDTYAVDFNNFTTFAGPAFIAQQNIRMFNDLSSFSGYIYTVQQQETLGQADGTAGPYLFNTNNTPIMRSVNNISSVDTYPAGRVVNLLITTNVSLGNTLNVTDDGFGNLIDFDTGVNRGTIDYSSGAISVTFGVATTAGNNIFIQYVPLTLAQPSSILFYQNQFTLRPVPDKGYTVQLVAYRTPSQALMGTTSESAPNLAGRPELNEWWEILAFGIAKKLYQDRLDLDGVGIMQQFFDEKVSQARTISYAQLGSQRAGTIYAEQVANSTNQNWNINSYG